MPGGLVIASSSPISTARATLSVGVRKIRRSSSSWISRSVSASARSANRQARKSNSQSKSGSAAP